MKKEWLYVILGALVVLGGLVIFLSKNNSSSVQTTNLSPSMAKKQTVQGKNYEVILHTTKGDITLELNGKMTPNTVDNFVTLAKKDFYNNTIFHRIINGFMIQGGDPRGNGTGGPGYKFDDEPFQGNYTRGTIAMANSGPNTNGSQFFIMHKDNDLPKNYVIFGKVTKGIEVVDAIAESPVEDNGMGEMSKPVNPDKITSVAVKDLP